LIKRGRNIEIHTQV